MDRLFPLLCACALLLTTCSGYNEETPIYKWSPIWFSRYYRTASLLKRAGEEPCVALGRRCSYWGWQQPCCGGAVCFMDHCR